MGWEPDGRLYRRLELRAILWTRTVCSIEDLPAQFRNDACGQCEFVLEDFEDGQLDEFLAVSGGQIIGPGFDSGTPGVTDSVDADDGRIDGTGQSNSRGHSLYEEFHSISITFEELTSSAGLVWTDGDRQLSKVTFEAFDQSGHSLGIVNAGKLGDGVYTGTTEEDRFLGVRFGDGLETGITRIEVTNVDGLGIEIDHIQYERPATLEVVPQRLFAAIDAERAAKRNPLDTSGDGFVSARDVLLVINAINRSTSDGEATDMQFFGRADVNGDSVVSARDVLQIINYLNLNSGI